MTDSTTWDAIHEALTTLGAIATAFAAYYSWRAKNLADEAKVEAAAATVQRAQIHDLVNSNFSQGVAINEKLTAALETKTNENTRLQVEAAKRP